MNTTEWSSASQKASEPMKWYDVLTIAILVLGALVAVLGWMLFDGTKAL